MPASKKPLHERRFYPRKQDITQAERIISLNISRFSGKTAMTEIIRQLVSVYKTQFPERQIPRDSMRKILMDMKNRGALEFVRNGSEVVGYRVLTPPPPTSVVETAIAALAGSQVESLPARKKQAPHTSEAHPLNTLHEATTRELALLRAQSMKLREEARKKKEESRARIVENGQRGDEISAELSALERFDLLDKLNPLCYSRQYCDHVERAIVAINEDRRQLRQTLSELSHERSILSEDLHESPFNDQIKTIQEAIKNLEAVKTALEEKK